LATSPSLDTVICDDGRVLFTLYFAAAGSTIPEVPEQEATLRVVQSRRNMAKRADIDVFVRQVNDFLFCIVTSMLLWHQ
jgi:hypothetical protein